MADQLDEETFRDTLEAIGEALEDKLQNMVYVMRLIESDIELVKAEEQRLAASRKTMENKIQSLKNMMIDAVKVVDSETNKVQFKGNPLIKSVYIQKTKSVDIYDEELIPEDYKNEKVVVSVDKKKLLAELKKEEFIPGAAVKETEGIRIR
jgi:hypothetical protein